MEGNYDLVKFSLYRQVVVGANKNSFLRPDEKSKLGVQGASYLWASLSKLFRHFKIRIPWRNLDFTNMIFKHDL